MAQETLRTTEAWLQYTSTVVRLHSSPVIVNCGNARYLTKYRINNCCKLWIKMMIVHAREASHLSWLAWHHPLSLISPNNRHPSARWFLHSRRTVSSEAVHHCYHTRQHRNFIIISRHEQAFETDSIGILSLHNQTQLLLSLSISHVTLYSVSKTTTA